MEDIIQEEREKIRKEVEEKYGKENTMSNREDEEKSKK